MSDREFTVQGRKKGTYNGNQDRSLASFNQACHPYEGTSQEFNRYHSNRYGHEEGLRPDGSHPQGTANFPNESTRSKQYNQYSQSTRARDNARGAYENGETKAQQELDLMPADERKYYDDHTSGYVPDQHGALERHARQFRDKAYNNATKREDFLKSHPYGYHSMEQQNRHHEFAREAYEEYESAKGLQSNHQGYRSYQADERRDKYGRRVADRRFPYE